MADLTNETDQNQSSTVEGLPNKPFDEESKNLLRNRGIIVFTGLILVILVVFGSIMSMGKKPTKLGPDVLAKVDSKQITKKDLQTRLWVKSQFKTAPETQDITTKDAKASLDELVEQTVIEGEAGKLQIPTGKPDIENYMKTQGFTVAAYLSEDKKQAITEYQKLNYLKKAISDKVVDWKELEYIEIPVWIRYFKDNPSYKGDVAYGKDFGQKIYTDWKSGKINFDEAKKQAEDDSRLGRPAVDALYGLKYLGFGTKLSIESYKTSSQEDYKKLFANLKLGYNEPVTLVTRLSDLESKSIGADPVKTEVSVIVANVTKANNTPNASPSYDVWLKKITQTHKVVLK